MSDLWVLRQHCMKIRYDSVMEVTALAQENFQKSLVVCCASHKYRWKLHHVKKRPYLHTIEKCWHLLWIKTLLNGLWQSGKLFSHKILWTIDRKKRGCCSVVNRYWHRISKWVNIFLTIVHFKTFDAFYVVVSTLNKNLELKINK